MLDPSLICLVEGPCLYRGVRKELPFYFGEQLTEELDPLEAACGDKSSACSAEGMVQSS